MRWYSPSRFVLALLVLLMAAGAGSPPRAVVPGSVGSVAVTPSAQSAAAVPAAAVAPSWDGVSLAVLGDSLSGAACCVDPANGWVARVRAAYPAATVTNLSRNGVAALDHLAGTAGHPQRGAAAMAGLAAVRPSLVVLALGTNDLLGWRLTPRRYEDVVRELVAAVRAVAPGSWLVLVHMPGAYSSLDAEWVAYGHAMRRAADATSAASYVDLAAVIPCGDRDTAGLYQADRVHLSDAGNVAVSVAVLGHLAVLGRR